MVIPRLLEVQSTIVKVFRLGSIAEGLALYAHARRPLGAAVDRRDRFVDTLAVALQRERTIMFGSFSATPARLCSIAFFITIARKPTF